jgi:hypothetical protein
MLRTTAFVILGLTAFAARAAVMSLQLGPATIEATEPLTFASQGASAFGMVTYSMSAPFVESDSRTAISGTVTVGSPTTVSASVGGVSNPQPTSSINASAFIAPNVTAITGGQWTGVPLTFTLPAHSSITFSAPYTMSYDYGASVGGVLEQVSMRLDLAQSNASFSGSSGADAQSSVLSLSFDNTSDSPATRTFQMHASFTFSAAPIPEPQTYALMLAGLGVLTVVRRRAPARN